MQMSTSHSATFGGDYVLCYYAVVDVTLFTLQMESDDDDANVNDNLLYFTKQTLVDKN